jgi:hypothetical protein
MDDVEHAIPGYELRGHARRDEDLQREWTRAQWQDEYVKTGEWLRNFMDARDPYIVLAKTACRHLMELRKTSDSRRSKDRDGLYPLEQCDIEIVQALLLQSDQPRKIVPTSPGNFVRFWPTVARHSSAFIRKQEHDIDITKVAAVRVSERVRLQTMYYRNLFTREDCETALRTILKRCDEQAIRSLGFSISDLFSALLRLFDVVVDRLKLFMGKVHAVNRHPKREGVLEAISFFRQAYPCADKAWKSIYEEGSLDELRDAGFQLSEIANPWIFTLNRQDLLAAFPEPIVSAIYRLALRRGELKDINPEHIHLNNPIWEKPYILLDDGNLFVAIPQLVLSFPFAIIEGVIAGQKSLEKRYEKVRAEYLEEAIHSIISRAMPSAEVYSEVMWRDPETGNSYENDIVAIVGNFIFIFEAKSGKIKDAARRGGMNSINKNFNDLFIEPGMQAWRLQSYINRYRGAAQLFRSRDWQPIKIDLTRPKIIFKFSICIEHFTGLTSARYHLRELGIISNEMAWAPVLTLGELLMIDRFLDSELSFIHYLSRRAVLEHQIHFDGDEQDLLSLYLTNGFCLDTEAIQDKVISFHEADLPVRVSKVARTNRKVVDLCGVQLSPLWRVTVKELYQTWAEPYRFDAINVILNQYPPNLAEFERRIRRWRRGQSHNGEDAISTQSKVANRTFILAMHLMKRAPSSEFEWREIARSILTEMAPTEGEMDCAVFCVARWSKQCTFDAVSFFRTGALQETKTS